MSKSQDEQEGVVHRSTTAIGGSVAVGGDMVNSSVRIEQAPQPVDMKEFLDLLTELREKLREEPIAEDVAQDVEDEVKGVQRQAEREKPNTSMILGKVKTITDVLSGAAGAGEKLVPWPRSSESWRRLSSDGARSPYRGGRAGVGRSCEPSLPASKARRSWRAEASSGCALAS